jgi:hypothetical protein
MGRVLAKIDSSSWRCPNTCLSTWMLQGVASSLPVWRFLCPAKPMLLLLGRAQNDAVTEDVVPGGETNCLMKKLGIYLTV